MVRIGEQNQPESDRTQQHKPAQVSSRKRNPFLIWAQAPDDLSGRKQELMTFRSFLDVVESGSCPSLFVTGGTGSGKSTLIKRFVSETQSRGMVAISVQGENGESEEELAAEILRNMQSANEEYALVGSSTKLPEAVVSLSKETDIVVFVDDAERIRGAKEIFTRVINSLTASKKANIHGVGLVISSGKEFLRSTNIIRLGSLDEHDAREIISRAFRESEVRMSDECISLILSHTGGNPRLFMSVCWYLYELLRGNEKTITKGHYLTYLPSILSMLGKEWFGSLYYGTPEAERKVLGAFAKYDDGAQVSVVASVLGKPLGQVTLLTRRLIERGELVKLSRGKYRVFAKVYGTYVLRTGNSQ